MTIKEIYTEAIAGDHYWLAILIEFLVFEKKVINFDDNRDALNLYFKPNNHRWMSQLLLEYRDKVEGYSAG